MTIMTSKTLIFFLGAFFVVTSVAEDILPTDLVDEAEEQLKQLQTLVQGQILAGHDDLKSIVTDFDKTSANIAKYGITSLSQERQKVIAEVTSIKDLALSAGKDISSCIDVREETLNRLPAVYERQMALCIIDVNYQVAQVGTNAKYTVDVVINTVRHLEFQLRQCGEELVCISPILQEIELGKIRLPQNIKTEVEATDSIVNTMKLTTQSCADDKVVQYNTEAFSILGEIEDCANGILD